MSLISGDDFSRHDQVLLQIERVNTVIDELSNSIKAIETTMDKLDAIHQQLTRDLKEALDD